MWRSCCLWATIKENNVEEEEWIRGNVVNCEIEIVSVNVLKFADMFI